MSRGSAASHERRCITGEAGRCRQTPITHIPGTPRISSTSSISPVYYLYLLSTLYIPYTGEFEDTDSIDGGDVHIEHQVEYKTLLTAMYDLIQRGVIGVSEADELNRLINKPEFMFLASPHMNRRKTVVVSHIMEVIRSTSGKGRGSLVFFI